MKRIFFIFLIWSPYACGVTLVYNLRIRRTFNLPIVWEMMKSRVPVSLVPIYFMRSSHIVNNTLVPVDTCEKRRAGGSLFNIRYVPNKNWWLEMTTGLETDHAHFEGTTDTFKASRTGFDDFVFSAGYRAFVGDWQFVGYGLGGLPAKWGITREDRFGPLVGTRFFNAGFGAEASYSFISSLERSLAATVQTRLIHGFNRCWFPILPEGSKIQPGNVTDLLLSLQYREQKTVFEMGYNATFFTNQAVVLPTQKIKSDSVVRHGWYASILHAIFDGLFDKTTLIGAGININRSKTFDAKTTTVWLNGTIVF